jgi:hypothetical protein
MRRGKDARQRKRLAHAIIGSDPGSFRSGAEEAAVEGAVVEIFSNVVSLSPLATVLVGEKNEQDAPMGSAVQENFDGATISAEWCDCKRRCDGLTSDDCSRREFAGEGEIGDGDGDGDSIGCAGQVGAVSGVVR